MSRQPTMNAEFSALHERVTGLDKDVTELKQAFVGVERKMDHGFQAINAKLDEKNKTPWGVIFSGLGFILSFCIAVGTLAYIPIRNDVEAVKGEQRRDFDHLISRDQRQWDAIMRLQHQHDLLEGFIRGLPGRQ